MADDEAPEEPDMTDLQGNPKLPTVSSTFQIKPSLEEKFKPNEAKELIYSVLRDALTDKTYPEDESERHELVKSLAVMIKQQYRAKMKFPKYKIVVNVVLGKQHGAGVYCVSRCFWDAETDVCASNTFLSETLFCMAAIFAVYFY